MTSGKSDSSKLEPIAPERLGADDLALLYSPVGNARPPLTEDEKELLSELVNALRTIRYGSIVLTVHDGQLVEINKSIRIRKRRQK